MTISKLDKSTVTKAQFQQIVEIEQNCGFEPYDTEMILECIEYLDNFVCCDHGRIIGFVMIEPASCYFGGSIYISNISVLPTYRGYGIAKWMLLAVCRYYMSHRGDRIISLDVAKTNKAMELYKKLGFLLTDVPSRNGATDVVMAMSLRKLSSNIHALLRLEKE